MKRRLGLRTAVVGRSRATAGARPKRIRVRFATRARKVLRRQESVAFTLRIEAVDLDGNPFATETKLRLR